MDLKTFVSESLSQIIQGIEAAQSSNENAQVNPADVVGYQQKVVQIEFDVAVTVEKVAEAKGGITVFSLGASGESKKSDSTTHHLRFSVPVRLPFQTGGPTLLPERNVQSPGRFK